MLIFKKIKFTVMKINFNLIKTFYLSNIKIILVHKIVFALLLLSAKDQSISSITIGLKVYYLILSKIGSSTLVLKDFVLNS